MIFSTTRHRALLAGSLALWLAGSGCSKALGLPDVSMLKNRYPVVHYVKLPPAPEGRSSKNLENPQKPTKLGEHFVVWEKSRPASWVSLSEVSKTAVGAIVVSEDWAFYTHKGYDPNQIKEAMNRDIAQGKFARGASTITQQVAKNVFLDSDKNLMRKVKELMLAVQLEEKFKKNKILETYLNVVEFGEGLYGIGPAAQFYFGKPASQLTAKEGAFLAMLLPSPKRYSQSFRAKQLTSYAHKTVSSILLKMTQAHYLTSEERELEAARPLSFEQKPPATAEPEDDDDSPDQT